MNKFGVKASVSITSIILLLLTGMHEFRNGVTHTIIPRQQLHKDAVILPEILKSAGYKTGFIGKWHLGNNPGPENRGFENRLSILTQLLSVTEKELRPKAIGKMYFFDEVMTFIEEAESKPFFCYLATYSPHTPLMHLRAL